MLLVHPGGPFWKNKDAHAWSIPKGEYEDGEDPNGPPNAVRRGARAPSADGPRIDLGTIRQASGKYVRAWAVRADHLATEVVVSNQFEMEWPPKSGTMKTFPEVDRAQWMTIGEANARLVAAQVELLSRLAAALRTGVHDEGSCSISMACSPSRGSP